jgi:glycosyltransferase involved in cell wall biosynthesis
VKQTVLAVSLFSTPGSIADDFATLCRGLARRADVWMLTSPLLRDRPVPGVREAFFLEYSKFSARSWLGGGTWRAARRFARQRTWDRLFVHTEHPLHPLLLRGVSARHALFWCHDPTAHSGSRWSWSLLYELAKRALIARSDRVLVSCDALIPETARRYRLAPARLRSCYLSLLDSLVFPDLGPAPDSRRETDVLFFGRQERYKGLDVLQQAIGILRRKGLSPRVVIAGPGGSPAVAEPGVTVINRYLDDRELARHVARARMVVLPYRDATGSQAPQAAFAYGTPVVATAVGCFPEYVADGVAGLVVPPGSPEALAAAMERLLSDQVLWERLSRGARERAASVFSLERVVEVLLAD